MSPPLQLQPTCRSIFVNHTPGIVTITDANTTIGYCRYDESGEIEYIYVNGAHRRKGHAKQLLKLVEECVQLKLSFQPPISPLGEKLKGFYEMASCTEAAPVRANSASIGPALPRSADDPAASRLNILLKFGSPDCIPNS